MWLKQKDGTFIKQETTQVVNLKEIKKEIEELEKEIQHLEKEKIPYPKFADDRLKQAIDMYNERKDEIIVTLFNELSNKKYLYNQIVNTK